MNKELASKILNTFIIVAMICGLIFFYNKYNSAKQIKNEIGFNAKQIAPQKLFLESWKIVKSKYYDRTLNGQNWYYWKKHYLKHINTDEDAYLAINSMLESLNDPYSTFLKAQEFQEQNIDMDAKVTGIGINIMTVSGKVIVVGVIDNSPAQKSDIKPGDIVLRVNDVDMNGKNLSDVAQTIRGEIDSYVKLELLRDNKKLHKRIQRKEIKIQSIKAKMLENDIGYIQISSFMSLQLPSEFSEALKKVQNSKGIIIDLRNNHGGMLSNAILLTNTFMNEGVIVNIHNRQGQQYPVEAEKEIPSISQPTVVLINKGSASASEIFSGALKDNNRAILVGETTYGKGMIQRIYTLPNNTGMNITVAKYLTPNGTDINKQGIKPNYEIKNSDDFYAKDEQLDKAVDILKKMI